MCRRRAPCTSHESVWAQALAARQLRPPRREACTTGPKRDLGMSRLALFCRGTAILDRKRCPFLFATGVRSNRVETSLTTTYHDTCKTLRKGRPPSQMPDNRLRRKLGTCLQTAPASWNPGGSQKLLARKCRRNPDTITSIRSCAIVQRPAGVCLHQYDKTSGYTFCCVGSVSGSSTSCKVFICTWGLNHSE